MERGELLFAEEAADLISTSPAWTAAAERAIGGLAAGGMAGAGSSEAAPASSSEDPYFAVSSRVAAAARRELFSFAAAATMDLGLEEAVALLQCTDTVGRLAWVLAAAQPALATLEARAAVDSALADPGAEPGPSR